jgi:DHA1 family inner membrane transport protein
VAAIGVLATLVIATLVPRDHAAAAPASLASEMHRDPAIGAAGLLMTVLGSGSAFTIYTYIQPLLTG